LNKINKKNKIKIDIPPERAIGVLWNACGFKKSSSKRAPENKNFEYLEIKKVTKKLIREKTIKYIGLNSSCIYLLLFFTI
tara:strand:+ start:103 stop:342 length:240 start_codon:yes stop_codon:yes gene_type:complete